ncbi:MAG: calcium-binding protein [Cyanobacteria bacterium J055]|nr:MAG: calcium-binding protein [Cyanobacteria bacterium J055]
MEVATSLRFSLRNPRAIDIQARTYSLEASISADGRFAVFRSLADNLVDGDTNNFEDIFVVPTSGVPVPSPEPTPEPVPEEPVPDFLTGSGGNDRLEGGDNRDYISGGEGDDVLKGRQGGDFLLGNAGNDRLSGNEDDDTLGGGAGDDILRGGDGTDLFWFGENLGDFTSLPFNVLGVDRIRFP